MVPITQRTAAVLLIGTGVLGIDNPEPLAAQDDRSTPRMVTSDLDNFWKAWDRATAATSYEDSVAAFEEIYRGGASEGLEDFFEARIGDVPTLLHEIRIAPRYYAALRPQTARVRDFIPRIVAAFETWTNLYPEAELPDVYFVIGRRSSGGTTSPGRILIGTEMYGRTRDTRDDELDDWLREVLAPMERIPAIVAHELIHTQQRHGASQTLLARAIREGTADFLGELISGLNINRHVHEWAAPREAELWADFQEVMGGSDNAGWLYTSRDGDEPADLGYWMGYRIVKAYYEGADDKRAAIRDILTIDDFPAFLRASGYDGPR